jgi:hypothetical protein
MIGHAALVQDRALVSHARLGARPLRFLLGDASALLSHLGLPPMAVCLAAILACSSIAATIQLTLTLLNSGSLAGARQQQQRANEDDRRDYSNHHDQNG